MKARAMQKNSGNVQILLEEARYECKVTRHQLPQTYPRPVHVLAFLAAMKAASSVHTTNFVPE